jgi:hypothetical protein
VSVPLYKQFGLRRVDSTSDALAAHRAFLLALALVFAGGFLTLGWALLLLTK